MTRVRVESVARSLGESLVDAAATVVVQAWVKDGAYSNVEGARAVTSERVELVVKGDVVTRDGSPVEVLEFVPTDGAFAYRWDVSWRSGTMRLKPRFTEMPDVEVIDFGDLRQVEPSTLEPTEDVVAAWETVRVETFAARDVTVAAAGAAGDAVGAAEGFAGAAATSASVASAAAGTAGTAAGTATTAAGAASTAAGAAGTARDGAVSARTGAETARDQAQAVAASKGQANGIGSLDASGKQPEAQVPDRLAVGALMRAFVSVRTSDGQQLPAGTVVLITIDKTLAQVTANPVADIADITFTTGA